MKNVSQNIGYWSKMCFKKKMFSVIFAEDSVLFYDWTIGIGSSSEEDLRNPTSSACKILKNWRVASGFFFICLQKKKRKTDIVQSS